MAVNINLKSSTHPLNDLGEACGLAGWAKQLEAVGAVLTVAPNSLSITVSGQINVSENVNTQALNLLLAGKLAIHSAEVLKGRVESLFSKALKALEAKGLLTYSESLKAGLSADYEYGGLEVPAPTKTTKPTKTGKAATPVDLVDVGDSDTPVLAGAPMALKDAVQLHTPVSASSAGSIYHTVAVGPVNAAARIKVNGESWTVSLRFEGKGLNTYASGLDSAGISLQGHYASQHLNGNGGQQMALRALGAMLFASGIPFKAVSSTPALLVNKGK